MADRFRNNVATNRHLHDISQVVDRLISPDTRVLRRRANGGPTAEANTPQKQSPLNDERAKEKEERRDQVAVQRLERLMEAITDPELLRRARLDQEGTVSQLNHTW